jgi:plasmid stability protein
MALALGAMPSVQIKNVPESVHGVLRARADAAGQSLQEYLLQLLTDHASQPTLDEVLDRAGGRSGGSISFEEAVRYIREDRDSR